MISFSHLEMQEFLRFVDLEYGIDSIKIYNKWQCKRNRFWILPGDIMINCVLSTLDITKKALIEYKGKSRQIQDCKKIICFNLRYKMSTNEIGRLLNIHHSTVMHAQKVYRHLYKTDAKFKEKADKINIELIKLIL